MTEEEDGDVCLEAMPTSDALHELDEISLEEPGSVLKAGDLAEVVIVRPDEEIKLSPLLDEAVLGGTKRVLERTKWIINSTESLGSVLSFKKGFQDVVSKDPPSVLLPDRDVRHDIDLVPGTKYCVVLSAIAVWV
ncbi:uncharacterized protein PHALS_06075 [Plasmopara halstedii]|uniref:Reverse transcriptase n=1 Tax=Plasmopara halstedii TaxID=4781 RepID=A0A0P1ABL4_PLAHL|nr:uncharacterized protein PHALS_06075 [Plasmopara halstedii]CEG38034.1 hypothetical protein PHALS_06075 [Plasmopara halstedii]|eukprot:XP_024574403.1 hypothetical protein PHALS_06075 [Plasmopara halstedii]